MKTADLYQYFLRCTGVSTDTRSRIEGNLFFCLTGENFNGNQFAQQALDKGAKYVVYDDENFSPNSANAIYVDDSLHALQELAKYHRKQFDIPIIGLTGSNGKTTTKELIKAVLTQKFNITATQGNLNNHIGVPLTLLNINSSTQIALIEMGANHLHEIAFLSALAHPTLGYITNFGKAHLEGFGSEEGVVRGKSELYSFLKLNKGVALINGNDQKQLEQSKELERLIFGEHKSAHFFVHNSTDEHGFCVVHFDSVDINSQLSGQYNYSNLNAAVAFGLYFELHPEQIKEGIEQYIPSNNRSQWKATQKNKVLLDAYNANPTSMHAALDSFAAMDKDNQVVILGDMLELGIYSAKEHQAIVDRVAELRFSVVMLIGDAFCRTDYPPTFNVFHSTKEAEQFLKDSPLKDTLVLLKGSRGIALEQLLDQL